MHAYLQHHNRLPLFIKWAGGKTQLLSQLAYYFPKGFDNYIEPFLGSGAVFFFIKQNFAPKKCFLSDINEDIVNCFQIVRDYHEELISLLEKYKSKHSQEFYYEVRSANMTGYSHVEKAARFIYLNKTCYNGLYRVNSKGKFNVPYGRYHKPRIFDEQRIRKASLLLRNVDIQKMSFENVKSLATKNDFIYFDPPYIPLSKTANFTSYNRLQFDAQSHKVLAELFGELHAKGCLVMLSNSDNENVRSLYNDYHPDISIVRARRAINSIPSKRGQINELVIRNYQ